MAILTGVWARYISIVAKEALFTPSETSLDPVRKSIGTYHNAKKELAVNRLLYQCSELIIRAFLCAELIVIIIWAG